MAIELSKVDKIFIKFYQKYQSYEGVVDAINRNEEEPEDDYLNKFLENHKGYDIITIANPKYPDLIRKVSRPPFYILIPTDDKRIWLDPVETKGDK